MQSRALRAAANSKLANEGDIKRPRRMLEKGLCPRLDILTGEAGCRSRAGFWNAMRVNRAY